MATMRFLPARLPLLPFVCVGVLVGCTPQVQQVDELQAGHAGASSVQEGQDFGETPLDGPNDPFVPAQARGVQEHCSKEDPGEPQVRGYVFEDLGPDFSTSVEDVNPKNGKDKAKDPRFGDAVMIFAGAVGDREQSCDNGDTTFVFPKYGLQFMQPRVRSKYRAHRPEAAPIATTHNVSPNFMEALSKLSKSPKSSKKLTITSFGDSITKYQTEEFDTFTEQFADALAQEVGARRIKHHDLGVIGSTSTFWDPDQDDKGFSNYIEPVVEETDLFVLTLGGNDVKRHAEELLSEDGICNKVANLHLLAKELRRSADKALDNIEATVNEIYKRNPHADLVLMLYIDFPRSSRWTEHVQALAPIGCKKVVTKAIRHAFQSAQDVMRKRAAKLDLVLLDLQTPTQEMSAKELSKLLVDPIHFNQDGHDFAFESMLKSLGGFYSSPKKAPRFRYGLTKDVM